MAAGTAAISTFPHSVQMAFFSSGAFVLPKGHRRRQNNTSTAMIDPNWITTMKRLRNSGVTFIGSQSSKSNICPVLDTGSHSVIP